MTSTMTDPLFEPITIRDLELKNRILMPAMHLNMVMDYQVTKRMIDFYAARARGGAGAIVCGFATVDELSGSPANIGAHDDAFLPGLTDLATAIKDNGARAMLQLNHTGRYNFSFFMGGKEPVAPSAIASRFTRETPRELTPEEIEATIEHFAAAAARTKRAGFDAVEVLSGTGYLLSQFLSPLTNERSDRWGGNFDKRMRFSLAVAKAVRDAVGDDYPVLFRINGNELMPGGLKRGQLQEYGAALAAQGVDALCVNVGWHEARIPQIVSQVPRGAFAYLARGIREAAGVPVIASHRINDAELARELLEEGFCDLVAMGRALIADPDLPVKSQERREDEVVHCIACAQGCFDHLFVLQPVECLCNPRAGHERETELEPAAEPRKVLVVGGGPAGMSAACTAADRGHQVSLYERAPQLGGQLHLAAAAPGRAEFGQLVEDLEQQVSLRPIALHLGEAVDEGVLDSEQPDAVILATGALPVTPPIPGADLPHVVQAWDVLAGRARTGRRVVVVGGGAVGVETALHLASQGTVDGEVLKFLLVHQAEPLEDLRELALRGTKEVHLVEMLDKLGADVGKSTRWVLLQELEQTGIHSRLAARVMEITATGIRIETGDTSEEIAADTVVLAVGSQSDNPLAARLEAQGIPHKVVGDAQAVAKAFDAVHQGFAAGREI